MEYKWDLGEIYRNLEIIESNSPELYMDLFSLYDQGIFKYMMGADNKEEKANIEVPNLFYIFKKNSKHMQTLYSRNKELFNKILSSEEIKLPVIGQTRDHSFDFEEVLDIARSFLYDLSYEIGYHLDELIYNRKLSLNKSLKNTGTVLRDDINKLQYIGVNAINKEIMVYILIHEIGHSYCFKTLKNENSETVPILLELYLNDYIKKEYPEFLQISQIPERFIENRNEDILTIKLLINCFGLNINSDEFKNIFDFFHKSLGYIPQTQDTLKYFLSTEKALSRYVNTKDRILEIESIFEEEKDLRKLPDFVRSVDPSIINANVDTIKRLVMRP